jgi:subtilisin family serine protease
MRAPLSLALGALLGVAQVAASAAGLDGGEPLGNAGLAGHESFGTQRIIARVAEAELWPDLIARLTPLGVELDAVVTRNPLRVVLRARSGSAADASRLASLLTASGRFDYALQETFRPMQLRSRYVPNDPLFAEQWALANFGQGGRGGGGADVGATTAWRYTLGSPDVTIAVLDDGVQLDHPDLAANIIDAGRDFTVYPSVAGAGPRAAADRHGTSVAGITPSAWIQAWSTPSGSRGSMKIEAQARRPEMELAANPPCTMSNTTPSPILNCFITNKQRKAAVREQRGASNLRRWPGIMDSPAIW